MDHQDAPENDIFAVGSFLQSLPMAAEDVRPEDVSWLFDMLKDPQVAGQFNTKLVSRVAEQLGSQIVARPATFLPRLAEVLAVYWERDDLLDPLQALDAEQATWLKTLRNNNPETPAPATPRLLTSSDQSTSLLLQMGDACPATTCTSQDLDDQWH